MYFILISQIPTLLVSSLSNLRYGFQYGIVYRHFLELQPESLRLIYGNERYQTWLDIEWHDVDV